MKINCSSLTNFQRCPFYYKLKNVDGWKENIEAPALAFGTAMHNAIKLFYKSESEENCLKQMDNYIQQRQEEVRTVEKGKYLLKEYFKRYAGDLKTMKILAVEKYGELPIGNNIFHFTIDLIVEWNNNIYVFEHKTSKSLGQSFSDSYKLQLKGYCYATTKMFGRCAGTVLNGILVGKTVQKSVDDYFTRSIISFLPQFQTEFEETFTECCDRIQQGKFVKYDSNCNIHYTKCDMFNLCVYGRDEKMQQLTEEILK